MKRSIVSCAAAVVVAACASSGGGGGPPVPVYTESEVPCEFEVMRTVRSQTASQFRSREAYESARTRALGREGAEVGADAVKVASLDEGRSAGAVRREVGRPSDMPMTQFEGRAVRFLPGTCSASGGA